MMAESKIQTVLRTSKAALLALRPITGRTHQLRLHCCHMGGPILGDPQYNSEASKAFSDGLALESQLLCAHSLEFIHPITERLISVTTRMEIK